MKKMAFMGILMLSLSGILLSQSIEVLYPNGGETLILRETATIRWRTTGVTSTIGIVLEKDGSRVGTIARGLRSLFGSYTWRIGEYEGGEAAPGTGYKIIVFAEVKTKIQDDSNGVFGILSRFTPVTHDFDIVDVRIDDRGKILATIKDLTSDFTGNLAFQAVPRFTGYTVERVSLSRGVEREVEVGDIEAPIMVGGYVCSYEYTLRINSDSAVGESNLLNNEHKKELPFYGGYFRLEVSAMGQTPYRVVFLQDGNLHWQSSDSFSRRLSSSYDRADRNRLVLMFRNCGYNEFSGDIIVSQRGSWISRSGDLSPTPQNVELGRDYIIIRPGAGWTKIYTLATDHISDIVVSLYPSGRGVVHVTFHIVE